MSGNGEKVGMVERVAKAIYHGTARNKPYEQLTQFQRQGCLLMARAAIEAMRLPTQAMLDQGPPEPYMDAWTWGKMVDAALQREEG